MRANLTLKNKDRKFASIYLVATFEGKRLSYYTGISVAPDWWNEKTKRVKEGLKYPNGGAMNGQLGRLLIEAEQAFYRLKQTTPRPSLAQLKAELDDFTGRLLKADKVTSTEFAESYISEMAGIKKIGRAHV